jgi:hypothetical protein
LHHLSLSADDEGSWVRIFNCFAGTLKTLKFTAEVETWLGGTWIFNFPNLECLFVYDRDDGASETVLDITAPKLSYYIYSSELGRLQVLHQSSQMLRLQTNFHLPLNEYSQLRRLELTAPAIYSPLAWSVLHQLSKDTTLCPKLESIELYAGEKDLDDIYFTRAEEMVNDYREKNDSSIKLVIVTGDPRPEGFPWEVGLLSITNLMEVS